MYGLWGHSLQGLWIDYKNSTKRLLQFIYVLAMIVLEVRKMDCSKVGALIFTLRREKGMTQKALADAMNISDRTISKWERGVGCPDVSLLRELSAVLEVNVEKILSGDLSLNEKDRGNMKKIKFYICPNCGNILCSTGDTELSCCSRKLSPLVEKEEDVQHTMSVEVVDNEYYVMFQHEMSKQHYISFVAYVTYDRVLLIKLYPEQSAEVRLPKMHGGELYFCCNKHGLVKKGKIKA